MTVQLKGARVLLTGATGGIGGAIARALHARGAKLILTGRRTDVLEGLAAAVDATTIAADLSDASAVSNLISQAGDIDILVANAALPGAGALVNLTDEQIDRDLNVNLRAPIVLSRWASEQMVSRGRGHIVLTGSLAGRAASPGTAMYNATKFGLRGFALAHREDLHGTGVGVSIVEPGFVSEAGMFIESGMPLPKGMRTVSPDDVARAVIRCIDKNLGEVMVAPTELKLASTLGLVSPRLAAAMQRRLGVADMTAAHSGAENR